MFSINDSTVRDMAAGIRYVCENFKDRCPGSPSERGCQEFFKSTIREYSDSVELEEFSLHPRALLGWIRPAAAMSVASIAMYWLSLSYSSIIFPAAAWLLITLPVLTFIFEFLLCRRFADFLYPKAASVNLIASRKASGIPKRRIIFGGHADAQYEWTFCLHGKIRTMLPVMGGASLFLVVVFVCNTALIVARIFSGTPVIFYGWTAAGIAELAGIPFFIAMFFFVNWKVVTCGANDNLTGCYTAMAVLKTFSDNNVQFENTEVCCLITGGEEAGLRGALEYAKRHKEELSNIETVFIALDTLRECKQLQVYTRGQTGTQKNSPEAARLLFDSAGKCGIDIGKAGFYPGATDAEAFSRYGIKAAALCGINHSPQTYYHTRKDNWYNVDPDCLKKALCINLEAVRQFDAGNLLQ